MMNQVVAPKVQTSSFANGINRSVSFKHNDKNPAKKNSVQVKKPKNSLEKSYEAFSEDLKKVVENHKLLQGSLEKFDTDMQKIKKELRDNANLLLLHKGLVMRLKQFQVDRHPILSKTRDFDKIEQRYTDYLKAVDTYRDIVGKLKLHSVKFKEQLGNWKQETRKSTYLLNDIITEELFENVDDQDDCIAASSSASVFSDYEYQENSRDWIEHHKCRFVHHERKPPAKLHCPVCPIQNPKPFSKENHNCRRSENTMETPVIDENSLLAKKIKELQLEVETFQDRKRFVDEKIISLQGEIAFLKLQDAHYDTIGEAHEDLSSMITEGTWIEKELVRLTTKINDLCKRQGFTKMARAFMATAFTDDEPFLVTTSAIHQNSSEEPHIPANNAATSNPFDDILYYDNTELQEDKRRLQTATVELQEELAKVKAELTEIYNNLNHAKNASPPPIAPVPTASSSEIQDLLSSLNVAKLDDSVNIKSTEIISADHVLQAKIAKELIKLASSYKIQELTFDVQASKRRFNFSTWFSKIQTILSMFPQTASIIQVDGTIKLFTDPNALGNKALFLLIGAKVDTYFQRVIRPFAGKGDQALAFIKTQCAHVSNEDKSHFHHAFTTLRIKENESATAFIRRFIFAKTEAESTGNLYTEHDLVSFVLTGLSFSKNPKYDTALQLYRLERDHGKMSFTLEDVEKRFLSMDEQSARDKAFTKIALGQAAHSLKRGKQQSMNRNKGYSCSKHQSKSTANANATTTYKPSGKPIICYNCGELGHIAPKCPHPQKTQRPHTNNNKARAAAAATTSSDSDTTNELVCSARVINFGNNAHEIVVESDTSVRATEFRNVNFHDDVLLTEFTDHNNYVTMWFESYEYFGPVENNDLFSPPQTEITLHDRPFEEDLLDFATIFELNHNDTTKQACRQIMKVGIMPALKSTFHPKPWENPIKFALWYDHIRQFVCQKLTSLQNIGADTYLSVTVIDSYVQLTFYPPDALPPTLHLRTNGRYFITYSPIDMRARAATAETACAAKGKLKIIKRKDPSINDIGDPCNLNNYLPDSGATQHMTPRLEDLIDVVEGQKLGVEVADGHVIKCSITGNIKISMQDDNGDWLNATLAEVMYVPGLSRRLFSITKFAQHGHKAIIQQHGTTLLFGPRRSPVTIPYSKGQHALASNLTIAPVDESNEEATYHRIPTYRNKDQNWKRIPLELLHARLGHRKCRTLLAASEHNLWEDASIRMTGETGCLTCGIATIRSRARNKEAHSGATRAGEYLFLDIQHPIVASGLTISTSYAYYLFIVDAFSRYAKLYGLPKKSTSAVVAALHQYQADHSPAGTIGFLDTTKIRADAGSQFTSKPFAKYCVQQGIKLGLAAPKKQYQNHLAERTWQTVTSTARSLLIHARLPDTFWYHALACATYIFNVLPVRGL
jgi:transposase InsO family protein